MSPHGAGRPAPAELLTARLRRVAPGASLAVDVVADLPARREAALDGRLTFDSWFVVGRVETTTGPLAFLVHAMAVTAGRALVMLEVNASVTDPTTGWYSGRSTVHPAWRARARHDRLEVRAPGLALTGTLDDLRVRATWDRGEVDLALTAVGHPLYNGGTGRVALLGMDVHQYSVPTMRATGRLVTDGREHEVTCGTGWFDRQWQRQRPGPPPGRWTWMGLTLDDGRAVSLWDAVGRDGERAGWATVVDADGVHRVADVVPVALHADGFWQGGPGRPRFPTRWVVRLPALRTELAVAADPPGQVLRGRLGERFEGASTVRGVVDGREVTGHGTTEMVGDWPRPLATGQRTGSTGV